MSLFQRKAEERRSIEEILTPKSESEKVAEEEVAVEVETVEIKSETAEEFTDNALKCFGWKDTKTEKWLVKCAKIWYGIMSFVWFLFGAVTFAPIVFMANKVNVIFNSKKKSISVAIGIYVIFVAIIVLFYLVRNNIIFTTP